MTKLYIANCTKQNQRVMFRMDFDNNGGPVDNPRFRQAKHQDVFMGRQVVLGGDLHMVQIQSIVDQLSVFGLQGEKDIKRLPPIIVPYIFNIDKPVSAESIDFVLKHNEGVLRTGGQARLQESAIAASQVLPDAAQFEVSVEQDKRSELNEPLVEAGFRLNRGEDDKAEARSKSRSRRAGA